jgi:DNA-binding MarR family transcriptional regulator
VREQAREVEVGGETIPWVLAGHTGFLLRRAFWRANRLATEAMSNGAHPRDFVVLGVLAEQDAYSQQDLAERLGINRTIMVKLIDKLEARGYVTRTRNPLDRRSYTLSVTPAGRRALKAMRPAIADSEKRINAGLAPVERERLNELLGRLHPSTVPPSLRRTGYLIAQVHHDLRRRHDEALASVGIQTRHFSVLAVLTELALCSQQQLAAQLAIAEPAAVQIVDELESSGLVSRGRDPQDRRRYALELTPTGRQRYAAASRAVDGVEAQLSAALGDDAMVELRELLTKMLAAG